MKDNPQRSQIALFIGIDWADQEHEAHVIDQQGRGIRETIEHSPESIDVWVAQKLQQANGKSIAIILEQTRGALIHALMFRENVILFPINPKQLAHYRESYSNAGCKGDRTDAWLLARMLCERHSQMKPWQPDDVSTRTLARLCQTRRQLVDEHRRLTQRLNAQLKAYFPLAIELNRGGSVSPVMLELIRRWPDPRQLQRVDRRLLDRVLKEHGCRSEKEREQIISRIRSATLLTRDRSLIEPAAVMVRSLVQQIPVLRKAIDELDQRIEAEMCSHPDAALFTALPGAGQVLAPRLLTAFGSQRDRFDNAEEIATLSGIAPVTKQSGKSRVVHRRYACPKYLRQTFHEFADHARKWCPWSRAYYQHLRSRNMKHHAALRKLAFRWIRILFRVWKTKTPYDANLYLETITRKNPNLIPFLQTDQNNPKKAHTA